MIKSIVSGISPGIYLRNPMREYEFSQKLLNDLSKRQLSEFGKKQLNDTQINEYDQLERALMLAENSNNVNFEIVKKISSIHLIKKVFFNFSKRLFLILLQPSKQKFITR